MGKGIDEALFPRLKAEHIAHLRECGDEIEFADNELIYSEGEPAESLYIVLEGAIKVTKHTATQDLTITVHRPGEFTGELSILTGGAHIATGRAQGPTRVIRIGADAFGQILGMYQQAREFFLPVMANRIQQADLFTQQREKLASLGVLAAGLAHELNNPAAAARSAAEHLRDALKRQRALALKLCRNRIAPAQAAWLLDFAQEIACQPTCLTPLDPLEQSDREQSLADWLDLHGVEEGWSIAPVLVHAGIAAPQCEALATHAPENGLSDLLHWLSAGFEADGLIDEIQNSAVRIGTLVKAVKEYSFMDQAPLQEIDVREGMENTLIMLGHKLKEAKVTVNRRYAEPLPTICAFGSELNQVWTNLLDNAIDALSGQEGPREICISICTEGAGVNVEIADNGPGVPQDLCARIFEPFFTTKGVGKGTGLGLDISYRIVVKHHHGDIQVRSCPGETCFLVRLPEKPPVETAM